MVASLGPASWSEAGGLNSSWQTFQEMIPKMIEAGTDIFRLNCSHRRGGDFERVYPLIRKTAAAMGKKVECLGDLQGPKFRVGELAGDPVELKNGEVFEPLEVQEASKSLKKPSSLPSTRTAGSASAWMTTTTSDPGASL